MDPLRRCRPFAVRVLPAVVLGAALGAQAYAASRAQVAPRAPLEAATPRPDVEVRTLTARSGEEFQAEYGWVKVPERRGRRDSRMIEVAYVRIRCGREDAGPPVVYLEGGPGGPGIPGVENMVRGGGKRFFDMIGADIVGIDQRGVGTSRPSLASDTLYGFSEAEPATREGRIEVMTRVCREEAERWRAKGVDLAGYTTEESADDVDAICAALGYDKVVLWGVSYGTHLGMSVIRRHEGRVARALLIGPEGPDHTVKLPGQADDGLRRIAALADAYEPLHAHVPDFMALLRSVLESLDEGPVTADVEGVQVGISRLDVEQQLAGAIGFRVEDIAQVPAVLHAMKGGDYSTVAADILRSRREDGVWSAMGQVMDAASGMSKERAKTIDEEAKTSLLGDAVTFDFLPIARAWGVKPLPDAFRAPLKSDVPILFIAGDLDSRTPVGNARELMEGLPNAKLIVVENAAHAVPLGVPELRAAWSAFLRGEEVTVERVDAGPIRFELPAGSAEPFPEGAIEVAASDLERCAGRFQFENGMVMVMKPAAGRLSVEVPGKGEFALWPRSATTYFCLDAPLPELTFEFEGDEGPAVAVAGGGIRAKRVD